MEFNFIRSNVDQVYFLPPDARDWLPPGHLAWQVLDSVAQMDLSGFLRGYRRDGLGGAAYHPAVMLALLLYCYSKGVRSSREIEMASHDDVGARVILGNHHPDHSTIARFVDRHQDQAKPLFVAALAQCAQAGLVTVDLVAGDGTKVKANASMDTTVGAERLDINIAELEKLLAAEVDKWFAQAQREDTADDALFGDADRSGDGTQVKTSMDRLIDTIARRHAAREKLATLEQARQDAAEAAHAETIAKARTALARIEKAHDVERQRQQTKIDAYRQRQIEKKAAGHTAAPLGPPPIPVGDHTHVQRAAARVARARDRLAAAVRKRVTPTTKPPRVNTTDLASRIMVGKKKEYLQAHNLQVIANSQQVILAVNTHDNPADVGALHPLLDEARANLDAAGLDTPIGDIVFDAGYASADNFNTPTEGTLYVSVTNEARQTGRRRDAAPKKTPAWQQMADRLATEDGKRIYKRRAAIIEPVFAQLFQRLGRNLNYRNDNITTELHYWATTHNLLKLFRHQQRTKTT